MAHARFTQEQAWMMYVALNDAAMSLETIRDKGGRDLYMRSIEQVRQYAHSRATVAFSAIPHAYTKLAEPITLLTQEQGGHYSALTCEDYDPDTETEQPAPVKKNCTSCRWDMKGEKACINCNAKTWPGWVLKEDDPLEVIITPLGLIGLAERAGIPATWDDGDGATSITAR